MSWGPTRRVVSMRKHWPGGVCSETVCRNPSALEEDHIETLNGGLATCMKKVVIQAQEGVDLGLCNSGLQMVAF
jgi:hypothetical protein